MSELYATSLTLNASGRAIPPLTVGKRHGDMSVSLIFDVCLEYFESGSADGAQKESARPEGTRMLAVIDRSEFGQDSRRALAFERADEAAQNYGRRVSDQRHSGWRWHEGAPVDGHRFS
jgi:hypothetical protein